MGSVDIFNLLLVDHARQRELMESIRNTAPENRERLRLFEELRTELAAHAAAEEQTLYAELLTGAREEIQQGVTSNDTVAELALLLYHLEIGSPQWMATFTDLTAEVERHLDLEEVHLFPRARKLIKRSKAKNLGKRFQQIKLKELCLDGGCLMELRTAAPLGQPAACIPANERRQRRRRFSSQTSGRGLRRRAASGGLTGEKGG